MSGPSAAHDPARVLVVCTANICRSPFAAELLRRRSLDWPGLDLSVSSAGIHAAGHHGICPELWRLSDTRMPADHSPTQIEEELITSSDLVLALTRGHRSDLVKIAPRARTRIFTLQEAATLAEAITLPGRALDAARGVVEIDDELDPLSRVEPLPEQPTLRLGWLVGELDAWRGSVPVPVDSIDDPHEGDAGIHIAVAAEIELASARLGAAVAAVLSD